MYILVAFLPLMLILVYESIYSRVWEDRYYARITLACAIMIAVALTI